MVPEAPTGPPRFQIPQHNTREVGLKMEKVGIGNRRHWPGAVFSGKTGNKTAGVAWGLGWSQGPSPGQGGSSLTG